MDRIVRRFIMVRTLAAIVFTVAGLVEAAQFIATFEVASVKRAAGGGPPGNRPVLDMTGIKGVYDFTIETGGLGFNGQPPDDPTLGPSIFTAVQDNLGLRLESQRAPIEVLVIDAVQRIPVQN
jgi:hypothetical protein